MRKCSIQKFVKSSFFVVLVSVMLSGCSDSTKQNEVKKESVTENGSFQTHSNELEETNEQAEANEQVEANAQAETNEQAETNAIGTMPINDEETTVSGNEATNEAPKRMVMLDGKLYVDTGETSSMLRCGMLDFKIDSVVSENEVPTVDNQSNFGIYGGQVGTRENRVEIYIDDAWYIFAYNENNFEGVTMEVTKADSQLVEVTFTSSTNANVEYGNAYSIERQDVKTGEWNALPFPEDVAFEDIAYVLPEGGAQTWEANLIYAYGELEPGKYRIVKDVHDFRGTGDYTEYTLMAEFEVL